ncbi:ADP-ribosylglycohydrolase [Tenericutes bacterium MZ-XQ]|nr:ADP-ribosylglycohydrolase [Tenericutes bacterium MZ-XQ]
MNIKDRAQGAFIGALIGEALGVGPHWFYNLDEQHKHYGTWIDDYTTPLAHRYHGQMKRGDISQQGWIIKKVAEQYIKDNGYKKSGFIKLFDEEILPQLDGTPMGGYGGYTSQVMRHIYQKRVIEKVDWDHLASISDTTESLERNIPTAIYYAKDLAKVAEIVTENTCLTQSDNVTGSVSVAFNVLLALIIQGEPFNQDISSKLMKKVYQKELPFHAVTSSNLGVPEKGEKAKSNEGLFASPDALLSPSYMIRAAFDPNIVIEPAWKVSLVYGMPCAFYHMMPAVYYLAAKFGGDFESGVLHAINGGGQNQVRAMLTGALIGAQVGLSGIPKRFIEGLNEKEELLKLADSLTEHL